jgi:hypothetical protein
MKIKTLKIPLYHADLIIAQDDDGQKILDKYNINFSIHGFGAVSFRNQSKNGYDRYVIAFNSKDINPGLIAHEALHVITYLFQDK